MKKEHAFYLKSYIENCSRLNKSQHTLINYRADLMKFFLWFELTHPGTIIKANGETISAYKDFLSSGGELLPVTQTNTFEKFKNFMGKMSGFFGKKEADTSLQVLNWEVELGYKKVGDKFIQLPLSVNSRRRHLSSLKNFFEFLKQTHEDTSKKFKINPVKPKIHGIKLKDIDVEHTLLLTEDDWKKLLDHTNKIQDRLMIHLLYWGGLRLSELAYLKREHFLPHEKIIKFPRKGGSIHTLKIQRHKIIFELLEEYLNSNPKIGDYIFPGRRPHAPLTPRTIYNRLNKLFRRARCTQGLGPHSFRKACATRLYKKTKDLLLVRDYLNHSDAKVTQTYIDI